MFLARRAGAAMALASITSLIAVAPAAAAYSYPATIQHAFVSSCVSSTKTDQAVAQKVCTCALGYIEARESLRTFELHALAYEKTGRLPKVERQAAAACAP